MNHNRSKFTSFNDLSGVNLSRTLSSPVAESTHLEGPSNRSGLFAIVSSPAKGATVVGGSVKRKPTSPLFNSRTTFKSSGNLSSAAGGLGRIDPQVYTDAQSRGLVNRLIKYHDRTQSPLNRSQSMTSIYNKPGQFPVVHLKKTEIKYSPRRNNSVTSVRIAPPEKSVFQANTRSNILRAGSLLIPAEPHVKLTTRGPQPPPPEDEIDAENRVIAPTAELDAAPTKSVLDALKEISRKRINNEELDADRIKKQCKELSEVDSGGGAAGGTKRARELPSSTSPPSKGSGELQLQKKRLCNKNNDILSSLSSSMVMSTPKRVEPIPTKPRGLNMDQTFASNVATPVGLNATVATERRIESREPTLLNRIESAPLPQIVRTVPEFVPPVRPKPTQPKITLFNKKYDETLVRPVVSDNEEQEDDEEELGGRISFIKPKEKSPILNSDKAALKQVEKSKLSLILSCLSEDFDDEEEPPKRPVISAPIVSKDTVDAPPAVTKVAEKKPEVTIPKPSGIAALISEPIKDPGLGKIEPPKPELPKSSEPPKTTGGFSFGTPTKSTDSNATFSFQTPTKPAPAAVESKPAEKPTAGGFSFGSTPAASAASIPKSDAPPAYTFPAATTTSAPAPATPSGFGFSTSPTSSAVATKTTSITPSLINFSPAPTSKPEAPKSGFSLLPAISTNASSGSPQNKLTTTQSTIPTFGSGSGFSAFKPLSPTTSSTAAATTTSSTAAPSFGGIAASNSGASPAASTGGFSFGAGSVLKPTTTTPSAPATTTTSAFSFGGATSVAPPAATAAPVFGASSTAPKFGFGSPPTTSTATPAAPSFGAVTTTTTAAPTFGGFAASAAPPTTAPPPFGSVASSSISTVTSPSSGIFGGAAATTKPATTFGQAPSANSSFSFGAAAQPSVTTGSSTGAFSFGGAATSAPVTTTAAPVAATSSNIFGSGASGGSSAAPSFGAVPSFGTNAAPPAFGAASPPAFGASTTNAAPSGFGAAPVFGAGSSSLASTGSSSVFGGSSSVTPSPFGATNSTPAASTTNIFGAASSNNNQPNVTSPTSAPFSFGASAAAAPSSTPAANKPFAFGGIGSANTTTNPSASAAANPLKSNSFSFSAGSNPTAPTAAAPTSAFSFGAVSSSTNNSTNPPPAFGSNTGNASSFSFNPSATNNNNTTSTNQAIVKPFSFGTPSQPTSTAPAAGAGIFGAAASGAASPPPAFNFSAGSNVAGAAPTPSAFSFTGGAAAVPGAPGGPFAMANGTGAAPGGAPMFSIGTGGGTNLPPGRRPIRTATRRLK